MTTSKLLSEVQLNVTYFYEDENVHLISAEEAARVLNSGDDKDLDVFIPINEPHYECICFGHFCHLTRSSLLALAVFIALSVSAVVIAIVLICTFLSLSDDLKASEKEELLGVLNWLHYPVGEVSLRPVNSTRRS